MKNIGHVKLRYSHIEHMILQLLDFTREYQPNLLTFPLDIKSIILLLPQYKTLTYSQHAKIIDQCLSQTENFCQSKTGCTFNNIDNQFVILYNDAMPIGRQRFTLAHELGHCILSHFSEFNIVKIAENQIVENADVFIESEADYFASTLLCPPPLCKKLHVESPVDIQHIFGLSAEASFYQYSKYLTWQERHFKTAFDSDIVNYFAEFVNNFQQ